MKKGFLNRVGKVLAPAALIVAMAVSPALAADRGGGHGGGGHSFAARSRGDHAYSAPARGFNDREFHGGRAFYGGRGYYGPDFGFGVGVYPPYGYAAPVCNPAGFYDANGVWQYYPGCAVPYGY